MGERISLIACKFSEGVHDPSTISPGSSDCSLCFQDLLHSGGNGGAKFSSKFMQAKNPGLSSFDLGRHMMHGIDSFTKLDKLVRGSCAGGEDVIS